MTEFFNNGCKINMIFFDNKPACNICFCRRSQRYITTQIYLLNPILQIPNARKYSVSTTKLRKFIVATIGKAARRELSSLISFLLSGF
jgi:hypothetical protein